MWPRRRYCRIKWCKYESGMGNNAMSLFPIPSTGNDRQKWVDAIEKHQVFDHEAAYYEICELHFSPNCIEHRKLKQGSIPSIFPSIPSIFPSNRRYCMIQKCENFKGVPSNTTDVIFFRTSKSLDDNTLQKWIKNILAHQKSDLPLTGKVCHLHFVPDDIIWLKRPRLREGAVPTIFPGRTDTDSADPLITNRLVEPVQSVLPAIEVNGPRKVEKMTCKQCILTAVEVTKYSGKITNLKSKLKTKAKKIRRINNQLELLSSQQIPLRVEVEDTSEDNQNYIPQKTYKRKAFHLQCNGNAAQKVFNQTDALNKPSIEIEDAEAPTDSEYESSSDDADSVDAEAPPVCEREQFVEYVMSTINELPQKSAEQAITAIRLFLERWPGFADDE